MKDRRRPTVTISGWDVVRDTEGVITYVAPLEFTIGRVPEQEALYDSILTVPVGGKVVVAVSRVDKVAFRRTR
jgi:hypothetical protein